MDGVGHVVGHVGRRRYNMLGRCHMWEEWDILGEGVWYVGWMGCDMSVGHVRKE